MVFYERQRGVCDDSDNLHHSQSNKKMKQYKTFIDKRAEEICRRMKEEFPGWRLVTVFQENRFFRFFGTVSHQYQFRAFIEREGVEDNDQIDLGDN